MSENQKFSDVYEGHKKEHWPIMGLCFVCFKKFQHIFINKNIEKILYPELHVVIFCNCMHFTIFVNF